MSDQSRRYLMARGERLVDAENELTDFLFSILEMIFGRKDRHDEQVDEWLTGKRARPPATGRFEIPPRTK